MSEEDAYTQYMRKMGVDGETCRRCSVYKDWKHFYVSRRENRRRRVRLTCRACEAEIAAERRAADPEGFRARGRAMYSKHRARHLVDQIRRRALARHIAFDLDEHIDKIKNRMDKGRCEMTGVLFNFEDGRTWDSPSIDRIKPENGYVYTNIRIVLNVMNVALGNWGEDKLRDVMQTWLAK